VRRIEAQAAQALAPELGRIRCSYQWFLGYRRLLAMLEAQLEAYPQLHLLNPPLQVAAMFDKHEAHQRLSEAGVPGPTRLAGGEDIGSFDALRALMDDAGCRRVFVKLRTGSSASGVVAYRLQGPREEAITSAELVREGGEVRLYNSIQIQSYRNLNDIRILFDALLPEGVVVERWVPKATWQGQSCDLRIVVIGGEARHGVLRLSRSPMTNLHLGNERGDLAALQAALGPGRWAEMMAVAEGAMAAFPGFHCAGIDLLCAMGFRRPQVLEINAFGDLLPRVSHRGEDTYGAQVLAMLGDAPWPSTPSTEALRARPSKP